MNAEFEFDFEKLGGLLPAVVQDSNDGQVLMVGFMNRQALESTLETGYVTFYSRTRQKLWMKGETSGNRLRVVSAHTDCDRDTLLLQRGGRRSGGGVPSRYSFVLHRGGRSGRGTNGRSEGGGMKLRIGIPKGSLQEATLGVICAGGTAGLHQRAIVFRQHRRSGD